MFVNKKHVHICRLSQKAEGRQHKMDIKAYLPCKKPRRSNRLEVKEREKVRVEIIEKTVKEEPLGFFNILPIELKFLVLTYLSVKDLSVLTITSKATRNLVEGFCTVHPLLKKRLIKRLHTQTVGPPLPTEKQTGCVQLFSTLGLLMKRSTCLYATKDRLKFVNEVLTKVLCCNWTDCCEDLKRCVAMTCFGKFLHTVIAGWDDSECARTYDAICQHTSVLKNVKLILGAKAGCHQRLEYELRCFFRRVFLDQCSTLQDRAFWLTQILKPFPLVQQARLLFLLYGPLLQEEILWYEHCENTPSTAEQSTQHFGELANALQILHHYKQEWSEDDVISIIDEITSSPDEWLAENVAHLLILCGDIITSKMLISKAINGRMVELSSVTTSFCVVCVKNSFSLNYVITIIQNILSVIDNVKDRHCFFNGIMNMFKELILDLHEFGEQDDDHSNDMFFLVSSLVEFTKKLVHLAFKDNLNS